jgi:hypothetical protein
MFSVEFLKHNLLLLLLVLLLPVQLLWPFYNHLNEKLPYMTFPMRKVLQIMTKTKTSGGLLVLSESTFSLKHGFCTLGSSCPDTPIRKQRTSSLISGSCVSVCWQSTTSPLSLQPHVTHEWTCIVGR